MQDCGYQNAPSKTNEAGEGKPSAVRAGHLSSAIGERRGEEEDRRYPQGGRDVDRDEVSERAWVGAGQLVSPEIVHVIRGYEPAQKERDHWADQGYGYQSR